MKKLLTLKEARITWSKLRLKYLELAHLHINDHTESEVGTVSEPKPPAEEIKKHDKEIGDAQRDCESYGYYMFAFPHIKPFLVMCMLDVKFGNEIPFSDKSPDDSEDCSKYMEDLLNDPEVFTEKTGGALISGIEKDLVNTFNIVITDRGFGCGGGHIGTSCTDKEKDEILIYLWTKYRKAIDAELIFPKIAWFFPPHFRDLWDEDEIKEYLNSVDSTK